MTMLTRILIALCLMAGVAKAQTAATPTWSKVTSEGADQGSSPVVTLTAGMTYRFGSGTNYCDAVTVTTAVNITVWFQTVPCTVLGVATSDPDPGVVKELDVAEQTTAQTVLIFTAGVSSSALVPALPPPPPPPPPPATTVYATTCTTTVSATGLINIILNAAPE